MKQISEKEWRRSNSRWIYWTYCPLLAPIAFFHIGRKGKKPLWLGIGFAFLVVNFIAVEYEDVFLAMGLEEGDVGALSWILGIVLAYMFKNEYLIRLEMLEKYEGKDGKLRERVARDLFKGKDMPDSVYDSYSSEQTQTDFVRPRPTRTKRRAAAAQPQPAPVQQESTIAQPQPAPAQPNPTFGQPNPTFGQQQTAAFNTPLDINTCSAEQMAKLPGLSLITAKKVVNYRMEHGAFASPEEFYSVAGLKPHHIVQVADMIACNHRTSATPAPSSAPMGRQLDL